MKKSLVQQLRATQVEEHAVEEYNPDLLDEAADRIESLEKALRVVLMYHAASWTESLQLSWIEQTGARLATTHTLCDFVRRTLGEAS